MGKTWNVRIDDMGYNIELKNNKIVIINGEELRLKNYIKKTGLIHTEYELPLGFKPAMLVIRSMSAPQLVIDNRDCETGEEYVPIKMPGWAYIFAVLHCINFINGAIGGAMAVVGIVITMNVSCNKKMNIAAKILINIAAVILSYIIVYAIALVLAGLLY